MEFNHRYYWFIKGKTNISSTRNMEGNYVDMAARENHQYLSLKGETPLPGKQKKQVRLNLS